MFLQDLFNTLWSGDQNQGPNLGAARLLEQVDGGNHGAAGRQHRVDNQCHALVELTNQFFQIGAGFQGFLVSDLADNAYPGDRDQAEYTVEHAKARTKNRNNGDFLAMDLFHRHRAGPAIDGLFLEVEILGGFIGQQGTDFLCQLTKILGADIRAAHQAELVADKRVFYLVDWHGVTCVSDCGFGVSIKWRKDTVSG